MILGSPSIGAFLEVNIPSQGGGGGGSEFEARGEVSEDYFALTPP